ncbi:MAG: nitroreductase family protein [Candidatus Methanomethyliaceae archaeon]|nr:nitroreductase family protein [Candidatus Methanomethyliaceae archaeon]MDW7970711.1 nitroreductase family protein [Nitrososphaerota archaeon]
MDTIEAINTRATVREFLEIPLKEEEKKIILESAIRAPNAGGNEQWFFIAVESKEKIEGLYKLIIEAQRAYYTEMMKTPLPKDILEDWESRVESGLYKAPFYVAVLKDMRTRYYNNSEVEDRWAEQSVAAAIENMILAAHSLGIGSCWFGVSLLREEKFVEFFKLDRNLKLVAIIAFGYPKKKSLPKQRKKGLNDIVIRI